MPVQTERPGLTFIVVADPPTGRPGCRADSSGGPGTAQAHLAMMNLDAQAATGCMVNDDRRGRPVMAPAGWRAAASGGTQQPAERVPRTSDDDRPARRPLVDEQLADQLLGKAQAKGVELLGPDGLLSQVTKAVLERALAEEMTGHLGYEKHDPAGRGSGNSRTGATAKTVLTDIGAVDLAVPRDLNGTFEPRNIRKGQTRLKGFNDRIIALYARGMTTRDIRAHLREMYDVDVSPDLISRVTDAVADELAEWQSRPLDRVYPVTLTGALMARIRDGVVASRPACLAIGIDCDGAKQVLSLWVGPATGESAKFWLTVLSELKSRGVADVCIVCCDCGSTGRWLRSRQRRPPGSRRLTEVTWSAGGL